MWVYFFSDDRLPATRWLARRLGAGALCLGVWAMAAPVAAQEQARPAPAPQREDARPAETTPQGMVGETGDAPEKKAFEIEVHAPDTVRPLIERHNELRRYQAITDLDGPELERLVVLTERNLRDLLGTQGYFNPSIKITRKGTDGEKPTIVLDIEPGEPTVIGKVVIDFEGDIAASVDTGTVEQRDEIRTEWQLPSGHDFTQDAWSSAKTNALRQLVARRYPAGKISYSLADIDPTANLAHLGLRLDSGPLYRLGAMQVTGTDRYDPVLVPRLARLAPGAARSRWPDQRHAAQCLDDAVADRAAQPAGISAVVRLLPAAHGLAVRLRPGPAGGGLGTAVACAVLRRAAAGGRKRAGAGGLRPRGAHLRAAA